MSSPDALISWYHQQIDTLRLTPTWTILTQFVTVDTFNISEHGNADLDPDGPSLLTLLEKPRIGINQYKVRYRQVPLHRSGPIGWTYFPATADGTRLARVSYQSKIPNVHITAMVKLIDYKKDGDVENWTVDEYAVLTIDNLNGHGKVEMRSKSENKRRKVSIHHK